MGGMSAWEGWGLVACCIYLDFALTLLISIYNKLSFAFVKDTLPKRII